MTPEDQDYQDRHARVAAWREAPTAPDDVEFLVELIGDSLERVRDRLLPEHSLGLDPADRAELEQLQAGLAESFDFFWLQSLG
jgi:hypothetical protein